MKKKLLIVVFSVVLGLMMTSCGTSKSGSAASSAASQSAPASAADAEKIQIVTTIFPEYDWVRNILGDAQENVELTLLMDNGVDVHSYQPTADDILKIKTCDVFVYVGGESDGWVLDLMNSTDTEGMVAVNLLEELGDGAKEEEIVEGMEAEEEHHHGEGDAHEDGDDHDAEEADAHEDDHNVQGSAALDVLEDLREGEIHEDEDGDDHEHGEEGPEYDEHVWLSLRNAEILCEKITEKIASADEANRDAYESNAAAYIEKLKALDAQYQEAISASETRTLLFGDRFPFRYMTDDYDLDYYAAFVGCSAETEASFETVTFLAEKVDELGLQSVMTIEGSDKKLAETIIQNTASGEQKILTLDSMQSETAESIENGATYLSVMESNLEVLKEALQ